MRQIDFLGKSTRDKQFLMLCIGKVLSAGAKVLLQTSGSLLQHELGHFHYSKDYVISDEGCTLDDFDYVLTDTGAFEGLSEVDCRTLFVSGSTLAEVKENERYKGLLGDETFLIFQNLLYDTGINVRYLIKRFGISNRHKHVVAQYINEKDMAIHLENEYDSSLRLKGLSKSYRKLILSVVAYVAEEDNKTLRRWMQTALRRG